MNDDMKAIQELAEAKGYAVVKFDQWMQELPTQEVEPRFLFIFTKKENEVGKGSDKG